MQTSSVRLRDNIRGIKVLSSTRLAHQQNILRSTGVPTGKGLEYTGEYVSGVLRLLTKHRLLISVKTQFEFIPALLPPASGVLFTYITCPYVLLGILLHAPYTSAQ